MDRGNRDQSKPAVESASGLGESMTMDKTTKALVELMALERPLSELAAAIDALEARDLSAAAVTMERKHLREVIRKYSQDLMTGDEVEEWANLVERAAYRYASEDDAVMRRVVHFLANPTITEELSKDLASRLAAELAS